MIRFARDLWIYRDLLYMLTWREISIKYKQSIMGFLWAILMPLLVISAGILVRFAFARLSGMPLTMSDVAIVSVKALPWSFFISSLRFSTNSLTSNSNLVAKIYFPKDIFPISAVLSQLFDFAIASVLLIAILCFSGVGLSLHILWVPVLIGILMVLVMSLGILLSAANLFFRDVKYLVEVFVTFAIFITPVFYEVSMFGEWGWLMLLNPVAPLLEGLSACVVQHHSPEWAWMLYSGAVAVVGFFMAVMVFKRLEPQFAESI